MALKTARGTRALLDLEDDAPDVLFEKLPGASVPFWTTVRTGFWVAMQDHDFGSEPITTPSQRKGRIAALSTLARAFLPSRRDARRLRSQRDGLYLVSGATTHVAGGKVRNWLVGDFADLFPESSAILQWRSIGHPDPAFSPTTSLDALVTRAAGHARLSRRDVDLRGVRRLVDEIARRLDDRITAEQLDAIASSAAYSALIAPHVESQFSRVLDRVRPRVVLMEDASYGSWAALVALMKSRGILVAEPQHGWIGPTHGAYNFGAAMWEPELRATLPDELLTFGEYWSEGIRHPARVTPVGKPHLEAMRGRAPEWGDRPREVLLVSSTADPEATTKFALSLRDALPADWLVRFRPHPEERLTVASRYPGLISEPRILLDQNSDVYESLARARGVVGVASTVMFEAVAMGCQVFATDSPFADYYVGDLFGSVIKGPQDAGLIAEALREGDVSPSASFGGLWKPGARANFRAWMESRLGDAP